MAIARARVERIEFRTTPEVRRVVERAVEASGANLTAFAESSLVLAAQRVMADRDRFVLSDRAAADRDAVNARPSRELRGLRALMERPSPRAWWNRINSAMAVLVAARRSGVHIVAAEAGARL